MTTPVEATRVVPPDIDARYHAWGKFFQRASGLHYGIGTLGILASLLATAELPGISGRVAAIVGGVCMALVGFYNPQRKYAKFVRAWRILDGAILRYRHGIGSVEDLVAATERAEASLSEYEERDIDSGAQVTAALSLAREAIASGASTPRRDA